MRSEEAVDIAIQIAQGLQKAHEKGIIHRDIKPANIVITNDRAAKILDFGLAKLAGGAKLTKTGSTLGTAAYMSPEQARGLNVDHRTDIWSLGIVLFEMLTGKLPFRGEHEAAMLYSIVHEEPAQVLEYRLDIPVGLALAVSRALQKEPKERYQSVQELTNELKSASSPAVQLPKQEKSIVVLPFKNLSPDPDQEYFCDGLTEEIISDLSNISALRVISRSSAMTFKGTTKTVPVIAGQLNVQYVLEGSARKAGQSLRITAQLIDAPTDAQMWSERYSGDIENVFDVQERLSRRIVDALRVTLTSSEDKRLAGRRIPDVRALECYLRALQEIRSFTKPGLEHALRLVNQALNIVGQNALLYGTLALIHWQYHNAGFTPDDETLRRSDEFTSRALKLEPDSSVAHFVMGNLAWTRGDLQRAAGHWKRSGELGNSDALSLLGYACAQSSQVSLGRHYAAQAVSLDPLNPWALWAPGAVELVLGNAEKAIALLEKGLGIAPDDPALLIFHAVATTYTCDQEPALSVCNRLKQKDIGNISRWAGMYHAAIQRDKQGVHRYMAEVRDYAMRDTEMSWACADCLSRVGATDEAMGWLENAIRRGFINTRFWSESDPFTKPLRSDSRFLALMDLAREKERAFEV